MSGCARYRSSSRNRGLRVPASSSLLTAPWSCAADPASAVSAASAIPSERLLELICRRVRGEDEIERLRKRCSRLATATEPEGGEAERVASADAPVVVSDRLDLLEHGGRHDIGGFEVAHVELEVREIHARDCLIRFVFRCLESLARFLQQAARLLVAACLDLNRRQVAQSNRPHPLVVGLLEHAGEDTDRLVEVAPAGGDEGEVPKSPGERSVLPRLLGERDGLLCMRSRRCRAVPSAIRYRRVAGAASHACPRRNRSGRGAEASVPFPPRAGRAAPRTT